MTPRNLTLFRFPVSLDLSDLEQRLADAVLKPVGALALSSFGFVPPLGSHGEAFVHTLGRSTWITVGGEERLLPGAVVNDLLQKKLAVIEEQEGRKPGGRARKRIKDELVTELLPRAFVRPSRCDALIDTQLGVMAVDTSSRKRAECVVSEVRRALGSFPALPLYADVFPRAVLTGWIAGDTLPDGLLLGDECELRDPADPGVVVKIKHLDLQGAEIAKHLETGKQCARLALCLDGRVSFVLGEDLIIRKFKLLADAIDQLGPEESEDITAELHALFVLFSGEFRRLFAVLETAFRISRADEVASAKDGRRSGTPTVTISAPGIEPVTIPYAQLQRAAKKRRSEQPQ